jgi:hypothetical protein
MVSATEGIVGASAGVKGSESLGDLAGVNGDGSGNAVDAIGDAISDIF